MRIEAFMVDLLRPSDVHAFRDAVAQRTADVDVLINNAALWLQAAFPEPSAHDIFACINTSLTGAILCSHAFLPLRRRSGRGWTWLRHLQSEIRA